MIERTDYVYYHHGLIPHWSDVRRAVVLFHVPQMLGCRVMAWLRWNGLTLNVEQINLLLWFVARWDCWFVDARSYLMHVSCM